MTAPPGATRLGAAVRCRTLLGLPELAGCSQESAAGEALARIAGPEKAKPARRRNERASEQYNPCQGSAPCH